MSMYMNWNITRPKNQYQNAIDLGEKEFREDHEELIDDIERGEEMLADIEKFKAEHEARSKKLAELRAEFEEEMSDTASKVESEEEQIDSMIAEAAKEFDGATFEVEVDDIETRFWKRGIKEDEGELEVVLKITNQQTNEVEEIDFYQEIPVYPYHREVGLYEDYFSALEGKIPAWQIQAVCTEIKEHLEDPENDPFQEYG